MKKMSISRITYDAVLAAICVVLGYLAFNLGDFKFTFENLPVIVAALLFGPVDGMLVGGLGVFLSQMIRYGVELSTPLWVIPYIVSGLFMGLCAKGMNYKITVGWKLSLILLIDGLIVTSLNTVSLYIWHNFLLENSAATMLSLIIKLPAKIAVIIIKVAAYTFILPPLLLALRKFSNEINERTSRSIEKDKG